MAPKVALTKHLRNWTRPPSNEPTVLTITTVLVVVGMTYWTSILVPFAEKSSVRYIHNFELWPSTGISTLPIQDDHRVKE